MNEFENMLIEKGYIKHILNTKTRVFEQTDKHILSTMVNLAHFYIHKSEDVVLKKIQEGVSVDSPDLYNAYKKELICFGLHETGKPPTLIYPRPKIRVKREVCFNGKKSTVIEREEFDNSMNLVLMKEKPERIFKSLFDDSIVFEYDLRILLTI